MFKTQNETWLFLKSKGFVTRDTLISCRKEDTKLNHTAGYLQTKPFEELELSDFANERKEEIFIGHSHISLKFIAKIITDKDNVEDVLDVLRKAETDVNDRRDWIELWRRKLIRNCCDVRTFNMLVAEQRGGIYNHENRSIDRQWSRTGFSNTFHLKYMCWPVDAYQKPRNLIVYVDHIPLSVIWAAIDLKNDAILAKIREIQSENQERFEKANAPYDAFMVEYGREKEAEKDNDSCLIS